MHPGHPDVSGGWLRPAVFGVSDGLVSNLALVMGVAGADVANRVVLLAGLAGLLAGAFSMAAGEYVSVRSQQEMVESELAVERRELARSPEAEEAELAGIYRSRGIDPALAREVSRQLMRDPEVAWRVHAREELGIDPDRLASPWVAAGASFVAFAAGAVVPLVAYLIGLGGAAFAVSAVLSAGGLLLVGALVSRYTVRSAGYAAVRQLLIGAGAAAVTYAVGTLIGTGPV